MSQRLNNRVRRSALSRPRWLRRLSAAQTCCLGLRLFGGLARPVGNGYIIGRSRLHRPFLYDRHIFVTVKLLPSRAELKTGDYERLAISLARMRRQHGFAITAWVFLPGRTKGVRSLC